jgi:hypothetical protein
MMVFHMVDRAIGRENFLAGLRAVAASHNFTKASWSDFMAAFARAGGRDLTRFQDQWLTRTGAPALTLSAVEFRDDRVDFILGQEEPAYALEVPVTVTTAAGSEEHILVLDGPSQEFTIESPGIGILSVDPDCHLFRRLHPAEIEPTISQVLAAEDPVFVCQAPAPAMETAVRNFATEFSEDETFAFQTEGMMPSGGQSCIVINPESALLKQMSPRDLVVWGTTVLLEGKRYSLKDFDLVFAAQDPGRSETTDLVILCDSPQRLEALARRVGHYGKYSWLLLPTGQGQVLRGNWPVGESPLVAVK